MSTKCTLVKNQKIKIKDLQCLVSRTKVSVVVIKNDT